MNIQNDMLYDIAEKKLAIQTTWLVIGRKHFNENVMVSVAVLKSGKTDVHFVDKGTKVDGAYYRDTLLKECLLPDIRCNTAEPYVFQQDGAPSHRVKLTIEFLQRNEPDFIEPALWPANSSDLNPVDYAVHGALQQMVYQESITSLNYLKEKIRRCWAEMSQGLIDRAVDQ